MLHRDTHSFSKWKSWFILIFAGIFKTPFIFSREELYNQRTVPHLTLDTQYKLRDYLKLLADLELQVERQRQRLVSCAREFEPFACFQRLDQNRDQKVSPIEIYNFMRSQETRNIVTLIDCQMLIEYFDTDKDGALSYREFLMILLPCDDLYLRSKATQNPTYEVRECLNPLIERELVDLLEREMTYQQETERYKREITQRFDWTYPSVYEALDVFGEKILSLDAFRRYLKINGYTASEAELDAIIRRVDSNCDFLISFTEFVSHFTPAIQQSSCGESFDRASIQREPIFQNQAVNRRSQERQLSVERSSPLRRSGPSQPLESIKKIGYSSPLRSSPYRVSERRTINIEPIALTRVFEQSEPRRTYPLRHSPQKLYADNSSQCSPLKAKVAVVRELLQRSIHKQGRKIHEPLEHSPLRGSGGATQSLSISSTSKGSRSTPMRQDEEDELIRVFMEQLKIEKEIEDFKIQLSAQTDFNLMDAFHLLDANSKGWITSPELYDVLQELGHHAHKELVFMFVRHFDRDNDGKLLYSDFCDAFSPKSNQQSVILGQRRAYFIHNHYHRLDFFSYETRDLFFRLFKLYFQHEETAELLRKGLQRRPYFNIHDAFAACDADKNGMISREELRELMKEYGIHLTELELTLLIDRYDKNHDGRISYSEFMDELMPRSAHHAIGIILGELTSLSQLYMPRRPSTSQNWARKLIFPVLALPPGHAPQAADRFHHGGKESDRLLLKSLDFTRTGQFQAFLPASAQKQWSRMQIDRSQGCFLTMQDDDYDLFSNIKFTYSSHHLQLGALSNSKKYPGPGSYELPDYIGPQKAVKLHSRVQTPHQPSIPKAFNRFILPKSVLVSPGPGNYQTIDCFTYNNASPYKILGRPVFPKDERKVFKEEIKTAVERPGPGQYQIISEFGNYEQPQFIGGSVPASAMNSTLTHY